MKTRFTTIIIAAVSIFCAGTCHTATAQNLDLRAQNLEIKAGKHTFGDLENAFHVLNSSLDRLLTEDDKTRRIFDRYQLACSEVDAKVERYINLSDNPTAEDKEAKLDKVVQELSDLLDEVEHLVRLVKPRSDVLTRPVDLDTAIWLAQNPDTLRKQRPGTYVQAVTAILSAYAGTHQIFADLDKRIEDSRNVSQKVHYFVYLDQRLASLNYWVDHSLADEWFKGVAITPALKAEHRLKMVKIFLENTYLRSKQQK